MANYLDYLTGAGETAATLGSGALAGLLGMPYGVYKGATSGKLGTPEANRIAEEEAKRLMQQMTYQPRGQVAPEMLQNLGGLLEASKLPPLPETSLLSSIPKAAYASQAERAGMAAERAITPMVNRTMAKGGLGAGLLGAVTPQPMRAIELGPEFQGKRPPKIENLARTSDKFLFHSSTADKAKDLRYGIEPQAGGPWVREVAQGAVEGDIDNFFENVTPLAWFSDKPEWIKAMVGRKLNKSFDKVTVDDIEKYGHLAFINKKSPSAERITYIPSEGLMEGSQSKVFDIQGNPKKAWETGLYQEGNFGQRLEPFGIERNEYVSPESIEPLLQLTGKDLVDFMKAKGLLEDNKFVPSQTTTSNITQQTSGLLDQPDLSYRGQHTAPGPDFGAPLHDLTGGGQMYPDDIYSSKAAQYYGDRVPYDQKAVSIAQKYRNKPNAPVTIYRAVPKETSNSEKLSEIEKQMAAYMKRGTLPKDSFTDNGSQWYEWAYGEREKLRNLPDEQSKQINNINAGDWVTLTREYAKNHGESALKGKYKIISKKVKAEDVWTNADSIHEFGYQPKETKTNKKSGLLD